MKYLNNSIDCLLLQFTGVAKKGYTFSLNKSWDSEKRKNQEILTMLAQMFPIRIPAKVTYLQLWYVRDWNPG